MTKREWVDSIIKNNTNIRAAGFNNLKLRISYLALMKVVEDSYQAGYSQGESDGKNSKSYFEQIFGKTA